jgi:hypothetical protein
VLENLTGPQKALGGLAIALVPPVCGLVLPGGLVGGSVSLDFSSILLATLPWCLSIAAIVWLWLAWNEPDGAKLGASAAILAIGAVLALATTPAFEISEEKADESVYYVAANGPSQAAVVQGGQVLSHNPRATGLAVAVGIAAFVAFAYALLYGLPLWLAGIVCGAYLGHLLHKAFTDPARSRQ